MFRIEDFKPLEGKYLSITVINDLEDIKREGYLKVPEDENAQFVVLKTGDTSSMIALRYIAVISMVER